MSNTKLTSLEAAIYQRELNRLIARLEPHVKAIQDTLAEVVGGPRIPCRTESEKDEVAKFIGGLPKVESGYYSGYYLFVANAGSAVTSLPACLENAIKDKAIREHLAQVDSITEVAQVAEQALHNSNQ